MKMNEALLPAGWPRPKGYANGVAATGRQVFVAGQIGWDAAGRLGDRRLRRPDPAGAGQHRRRAAERRRRAEAHRAHDLVRDEQARVPRRRRGRSARRFARSSASTTIAMTAVEVTALIEDRAKVEIEVTAVIPD